MTDADKLDFDFLQYFVVPTFILNGGNMEMATSVYEENSILALKRDWERLINSENGLIYLTFDYYFNLVRTLHLKNMIFRRCYELRFIVHTSDEQVDIIVPLLFDDKHKTISSCGETTAAGYNDIVCESNIKNNYVKDTFDYIFSRYFNYKISLSDIYENSVMGYSLELQKSRQCYRLNIESDYSGWFNSLSKGKRQSIRSAYNRLQKDGLSFEFQLVGKTSVFLLLRCCYIYRKRLSEIKGEKKNKLYLLAETLIYTFVDANFHDFNKMKREKIAYLKINKKLVAFFIYYEEKNGIITPKTAFDSFYARYSPGMILFTELIKYFGKNNSNFIIDLSRDYHKYKEEYGAFLYHNYCYCDNKHFNQS